jgi:hypothetical protein
LVWFGCNGPFTGRRYARVMGDLIRFKQTHRTSRDGHAGPYRRRRTRKSESFAYPLFVGCCALLAGFAVFNSDKLPAVVQSAVIATHDPARKHSPAAEVYYPNCDAARAAGVAPIYAGEPGYRKALDGDRDGIACEPYRGM